MIIDLQKASVMKRFSAFLLDIICICIAATLFAWIFSIAVDYTGWSNKYQECKMRYEQKYGINTLTDEEYAKLSQEEKAEYDEKNEQAKLKAEQALQDAYRLKDPEALETVKTINMVNNLILLMLSLSALFGVLIVEFIVPLFLKNGQTLGKKIFSVAVMRTNSVKINSVCLFIRSLLGKYAIETMIPIYIIVKVFLGSANIFDMLLLFALILVQLIMIIVTKNNLLLHDLLSDTVAVDMSAQMIFDSESDLIKYKEELHNCKVNTSTDY